MATLDYRDYFCTPFLSIYISAIRCGLIQVGLSLFIAAYTGRKKAV